MSEDSTEFVRARLARAAPASVDNLERRAAELWSVEPQVPDAHPLRLLVGLAHLDADVDTLQIRCATGIDVQPFRGPPMRTALRLAAHGLGRL